MSKEFATMDQLFGPLKAAVKFSSVLTDNEVFRLHYKVTMPILIAFSLLVTSRQYFGDPISCISKDDIPTKVLDTYCWVHGTFSLPKAWQKKVGVEVPYPGIDKYVEGEERVYHAYYQWVCFLLFLQALLFYVPRYFWKAMEFGKIRHVMRDLNNPILNKKKKSEDIQLLGDYIMNTLHHNNPYFVAHLVAEVLNLINVVGQMFLMDTFLGNAFSLYGIKVIEFTEWDSSLRFDPMVRVFPRLAKCTFHRFGSSGDVQKHDAMCILPINIINEKIYVFLWFWFVFLAILSCGAVLVRIIQMSSPVFRRRLLKKRAQLVEDKDLKIVLKRSSIGDWFVIYLLSKNLASAHFCDLIKSLVSRCDSNNYAEDSSG